MGRSFDDVKKLASRPTDTVSLCLAGEMVEEIGRLEQQLADVPPPSNIAEPSPKQAIAERIVALQEGMRDATVDFHLQALPSRKWGALFADQPRREEGEAAEVWEPRWFAWQARIVSASCVDPVMDVDQVGELVDLLHFRAWIELYTKSYVLNMGEVDVPNSEAASELIRTSGQT
jgi:hypothetical protein